MTEITKQKQVNPRSAPSIIRTFDDVERVAKAMAASGYFRDAQQTAQAIVKILAGHELGFGPYASMAGIPVVLGKLVVGANLIAAAVKRSDKYDYVVADLGDDKCVIDFYERGTKIGTSSFSMDDARTAGSAGKDIWSKYRRNMLFARAISNGARWYTPDIFYGIAVYTPDKLGLDMDVDGNAIDANIDDGGDTSAYAQPASERMLERYRALMERAEVLGVDTADYQLADGQSADEIMALGIRLKALADEAEKSARTEYQAKLDLAEALLINIDGYQLSDDMSVDDIAAQRTALQDAIKNARKNKE